MAAHKGPKDKVTKKELHDLYWIEGLTLKQIGERYGVSGVSVRELLKKWEIPRKDGTKYTKIGLQDKVSKEELHKLYWIEEKTLAEIGERYEVTKTAVKELMKKWEIPRRDSVEAAQKPLQKLLSKVLLKDLYIEQKKSASEIAKMFPGSSQTGVNKLLGKYEIKKRTNEEAIQLYFLENPNFNSEFFKKESSGFFYIIGLLLTDGTLTKNGSISLDLTDKEEIEWVAEKIELKTPISKRIFKNKKDIYGIKFSHKEVVQVLNEYGMVERKSKILKCPNIPEQYTADFIRGVFDGDGSISIKSYIPKRNPKKRYACVNIASGSESFMTGIKKYIEQLIGGERPVYFFEQSGAYYYQFAKAEDIIKFTDIIYDNDAFGMERKKQKLLNFKRIYSE